MTTSTLFGSLILFYPDPYEGGQIPSQPFLGVVTSDNGDGTANLVTISADGRIAARLNVPTFAAGATVTDLPGVYAVAIAGGVALSTVPPLLVKAAVAAVAPDVPLAATLGANTTLLETPAVPGVIEPAAPTAPVAEATPATEVPVTNVATPAATPAAAAPVTAPAAAAPAADPLAAASAILSPAAPAA